MENVIDRTAEKVELAKELGLKEYVRTKEQIEEDKQIALELTKMKFNRINEKEIKKKICKRVWDWKSLVGQSRFGMFLATIIFSPVVFMFCDASMVKPKDFFSWYGVFLLASWSLIILSCYRKTEFREMLVSDWADELPYGAMLAMKEASENGVIGFKNYNEKTFKIYYPIYASSNDRVKADPVITGLYKGKEVEIFAWDDSKVYE